jgi:hypothetical protein
MLAARKGELRRLRRECNEDTRDIYVSLGCAGLVDGIAIVVGSTAPQEAIFAAFTAASLTAICTYSIITSAIDAAKKIERVDRLVSFLRGAADGHT